MTERPEIPQGAAIGAPPPLRLSRTFHAPRRMVFAAWTDADHVGRWFCPEGSTVAGAEVEPRVGGAFDVCMRSPDGEPHWTRGVFAEVTLNERLVIDMSPTDRLNRPLFRAHTVVAFFDALGGTRLEVTQTFEFLDRTLAAPMVAGAAEGWRTTLDRLGREIVRLLAAPDSPVRSVVHGMFHLERTYDAPAERVWKALTDPDAKARWFGGEPGAWEPIERHMDVRPGGSERAKGRWEGGLVTTFDAHYHDVVPLQRLVYSYEMHMDETRISVSLATMQLKADGARTTLMVTEQGAFLDGYDDAGAREQGTGLLLEALGASLAE